MQEETVKESDLKESSVPIKNEVPLKRVGISMIEQPEETIKVGMALGFNMEGCEATLEKIIGEMGDAKNLIDVPLGGFRFTWTDNWATKMSKLDRFMVSEGFYDTFPLLTGTVVEKGIPDHRPILLKESAVDYGPTPFHFFHSWLESEGFYDLVVVVDTWRNDNIVESNGMVSFKKKFHNLKQVIRSWVAARRLKDKSLREEHKNRVISIDTKVDLKTASNEDLIERAVSIKIIGDIDRKEASNLAQKAKIKWAIE
nr:RNA-directed DNA polymerase, eukaryota, reverse transcriptase zinc-binding domain protein [Tanacetum cinerariifolium]